MSYIGTNAGMIVLRWYYKRLIDKGDAPLLDPEAALNAPELPKNHPYFDFKARVLIGLVVFGLIAGFGIIPALFYFAQREYFSYLQPLIFDNTLSAVLTIFPAIFLSCGLFGLLSLWLNSVNNTFSTYSAYGLIVNANKHVQGLTFKKIPFERLITKEHVKKIQKHQQENSKKWLFWMFVITLPFIYMLWNSYSYATNSEIATVLVNSKTSYAYKDAKQIDISFVPSSLWKKIYWSPPLFSFSEYENHYVGCRTGYQR